MRAGMSENASGSAGQPARVCVAGNLGAPAGATRSALLTPTSSGPTKGPPLGANRLTATLDRIWGK